MAAAAVRGRASRRSYEISFTRPGSRPKSPPPRCCRCTSPPPPIPPSSSCIPERGGRTRRGHHASLPRLTSSKMILCFTTAGAMSKKLLMIGPTASWTAAISAAASTRSCRTVDHSVSGLWGRRRCSIRSRRKSWVVLQLPSLSSSGSTTTSDRAAVTAPPPLV